MIISESRYDFVILARLGTKTDPESPVLRTAIPDRSMFKFADLSEKVHRFSDEQLFGTRSINPSL